MPYDNFKKFTDHVYSGKSIAFLVQRNHVGWAAQRVGHSPTDVCLVCSFQRVKPSFSIPDSWRKLLKDQEPYLFENHSIPIMCCSKCYPLCPLVGQLSLVDHTGTEGDLSLTTTSGSLSLSRGPEAP